MKAADEQEEEGASGEEGRNISRLKYLYSQISTRESNPRPWAQEGLPCPALPCPGMHASLRPMLCFPTGSFCGTSEASVVAPGQPVSTADVPPRGPPAFPSSSSFRTFTLLSRVDSLSNTRLFWENHSLLDLARRLLLSPNDSPN